MLNLVEWEKHAEKACALGIDARVKKLYGLAKVQNHESTRQHGLFGFVLLAADD